MPTDPIPISITINPTTATISNGSYTQFTGTLHYDDGSSVPQVAGNSHFASSDTDVARMSNDSTIYGRAYAITPGACTITITASEPWAGVPPGTSFSASATLTVVAAPAPTPPPAARFALAFGAATLDPGVTWTAIDAHPNLVTSYSIDRGRSYELDQTDAGSASVTITDPDGILDPTNPSGPYYGQIRPLLHGILCRHNPVTDTWEPRFRGYVEDYTYDVDPSQQVNRLTVSLGDLFEIVSAAEMQPGQFGENVNGQVYYYGGSGGLLEVTPDQRIGNILIDARVPSSMFVVLPGSVHLRSTTYSAGESALTACQEAANAEFPHVANLFCDRRGRIVFHGRKARFDPSGTATAAGSDAWDYHDWKAGDGTAVNASPTDTAQVRTLSYQRGVSKIINTATALEAGAPDDQVAARRITDSTSIATYGIRSWSESNLLTLIGDIDQAHPTSAETETKRFARFYVDNYKQPKDRITALTFRSLHPADPRAAANWQLLSKVDIGDTLEVTVAVPGGGGFHAETYFVEGVHEDVQPLAPGYDDVTLTLDLSPRSYYTANPWVPLTSGDGTMPADPSPDPGPVLRSGKPKPKSHGGDHKHRGADPVRINSAKAPGSTEAGDGSGTGGDVDLTGYLHYNSVGANTGDSIDITTTSGNINLHTDNVIADHSVLAQELGAADAVAATSMIVQNTGTYATTNAIDVTASGGIGLKITGAGITITRPLTGGGQLAVGVAHDNLTGLQISFDSAPTGAIALGVDIAGTTFQVRPDGVFYNGNEVATI